MCQKWRTCMDLDGACDSAESPVSDKEDLLMNPIVNHIGLMCWNPFHSEQYQDVVYRKHVVHLHRHHTDSLQRPLIGQVQFRSRGHLSCFFLRCFVLNYGDASSTRVLEQHASPRAKRESSSRTRVHEQHASPRAARDSPSSTRVPECSHNFVMSRSGS